MRLTFAIIFILLIVALGTCFVLAKRSQKAMGTSVAFMMGSLILPVIGNLIIIISSRGPILPTIGYYIYILGMDFTIFSLLCFTFAYCSLSWPNQKLKWLVNGLLIVDLIQLSLNPIFGHAFTTEPIVAYGSPYYRLVPFFGQTFHRIVDYGILAAVIVIFTVKTIRSSKITP